MSPHGRGLTLVFVSPEHLNNLVEGGHVRSLSGYIGPDRNWELEDLENRREGFSDREAETPFEESGAYGDFAGVFGPDVGSYADDPTDDLLHRIGALSNGGKR